jgi:hypothetical protein
VLIEPGCPELVDKSRSFHSVFKPEPLLNDSKLLDDPVSPAEPEILLVPIEPE